MSSTTCIQGQWRRQLWGTCPQLSTSMLYRPPRGCRPPDFR